MLGGAGDVEFVASRLPGVLGLVQNENAQGVYCRPREVVASGSGVGAPGLEPVRVLVLVA